MAIAVDQAMQLAVQHHVAGQLADAERLYRQVLGQRPNHAEALHLLGVIAHQVGRNDESIDLIGAAIAVDPSKAAYYSNLGNSLGTVGRLEEAVASCRRAIALQPNLTVAYFNLGNALKEQGCIPEAIAVLRKAIELAPQNCAAHSALLLALHSDVSSDSRTIFEEARRWNNQHAGPLASTIKPHFNDRSTDRKLRVGYVSADFFHHASALFLKPLLRSHNRDQFEITCYAELQYPDALTEQFQRDADSWRATAGVSDEGVAEQIRQDRIDVLVDLKVHTARNRLLVFARKPAPVQLTWLGYPGTTGLDTMDYRLTDPWLDPFDAARGGPAGMDDAFYSEESIRLPDCFWCYEPLEPDLPVNPLAAQAQGHITFGCLNMFTKVNEQVLKTWAKILHGVHGSRIVFLCNADSRRDWARRVLGEQGIAAERIEFHARRPRRDYLALYHRIDVGLDTFPCNGHTTTLDSLWMGVPVITLAGRFAVARGAASILSNIGLPQCAVRSEDEYVHLAVQMAQDTARLADLRSKLRARMEQSPLMDAAKFTRNIESVYRMVWRRWCEKRS